MTTTLIKCQHPNMFTMRCAVCNGKTEREEIERAKKQRLLDADKSLEGADLHKRVCEECGHIAYIRDN